MAGDMIALKLVPPQVNREQKADADAAVAVEVRRRCRLLKSQWLREVRCCCRSL